MLKLKENGKSLAKVPMSIKDIQEPDKPAFKVIGFIPNNKKRCNTKPIWPSYMDKYDGQTLEIEEINSDGYLVIDGWKFNSVWCTKVEAPNQRKVGDRCIFGNEDKSEMQVIGKLTEIKINPISPL